LAQFYMWLFRMAESVCLAGGTPVKFEGVWPVSMGGLLLQVLWQVDDHDGIKGTFLCHTAEFSRHTKCMSFLVHLLQDGGETQRQ
jgi:hypothetical protein